MSEKKEFSEYDRRIMNAIINNNNYLWWLFGSCTTTTDAVPNTHSITDKNNEIIDFHIEKEEDKA